MIAYTFFSILKVYFYKIHRFQKSKLCQYPKKNALKEYILSSGRMSYRAYVAIYSKYYVMVLVIKLRKSKIIWYKQQ